MMLGGRAAELVKFGVATTGAANDIERATELARKMVTQYGMSERFGAMGLQSTQNQYLDGRSVATCSEETNTLVGETVREILDGCQRPAMELLRQNQDALDRIAGHLLEKENISGTEFMELLREEQD